MNHPTIASVAEDVTDVKASLRLLHEKLDAALLQQARHDEQIKQLRQGAGGGVTLLLAVAGYWLKSKLHL